jgi:primosomal replication protein N
LSGAAASRTQPGAGNEVSLTGILVSREALRYTPAGIPVVDAVLAHRSEVAHAGQPRQLEFDLAVSFAGPVAGRADALVPGTAIAAGGFIAPRRRHSKSLVLHVTRFVEVDASGLARRSDAIERTDESKR